jgi:aspartate racemase
MTTLRHTGILAHSVPGAALCFSRFCEAGMAALGEHEHPEVTLDCIPMGRSMAAWESGDLDAVREVLAASAERLARVGCDFFVCPDNTAHPPSSDREGICPSPACTSRRWSPPRRPAAVLGG